MSFTTSLLRALDRRNPAPSVHAHCDGPCGVYDPASARIAAEAVLSMTKKLLELGEVDGLEAENTRARYIGIKESEAEECKRQLLILWTDYFKPVHLEVHPQLHDTFWQAAKACSATKTSVSLQAAEQLLTAVESVHHVFWSTKGRDIPWYTAS